MKPHLNSKKLSVVVRACHPSEGEKPKIRGSWSKPTQKKSETLFPKIMSKNFEFKPQYCQKKKKSQ
jgi:hypothetical protein